MIVFNTPPKKFEGNALLDTHAGDVWEGYYRSNGKRSIFYTVNWINGGIHVIDLKNHKFLGYADAVVCEKLPNATLECYGKEK